MNISVPKDFPEKLKAFVPDGNVSKYIVKTMEEKIAYEEKMAALKFFEDAGPLFPHIKDSAKYVRDLRREETKHRMKKAGL